MDTPVDCLEQPVHLVIGRRQRLVESQDPALLDIDAVEHERMHVDVQIQGSAEALNDRHGPAASTGYAGLPHAAPKKPEHRPHENARDRTAQRVVPRQHVPQAMRQTQDPLPHGHDRKHVIDEMRRTSAIRRPPQLGQTALPLQENGTSRSSPHRPQRNRANPPARNPQRKNPRNSSSMNRGSASRS